MVCAKLNEGISPLIQTQKGVPHGCTLSPTLFNIFMSDLPNKLCREVNIQLEEKIVYYGWVDKFMLLK